MPDPSPCPYLRVADDVPVCERVAILGAIALQGTRVQPVRDLLDRVDRVRFLSPEARLATLLATVQALPYRLDPPGEERYQDVACTAVHGGDCADLATTLVALAACAGVPAQVVWITQTGKPLNHVTAALWDGRAWRWAEASIRGARFGESAYDAVARLGRDPARVDLAA